MRQRTGFLVAVSVLLVSGFAMAEGENAGPAQMGPMHGGRGQRKAAMQECIKSGKAMPECRQEMMKAHKGAMGKGECPMMKEHKAEHKAEHEDSKQEG
jgi:hypothetical protein